MLMSGLLDISGLKILRKNVSDLIYILFCVNGEFHFLCIILYSGPGRRYISTGNIVFVNIPSCAFGDEPSLFRLPVRL